MKKIEKIKSNKSGQSKRSEKGGQLVAAKAASIFFTRSDLVFLMFRRFSLSLFLFYLFFSVSVYAEGQTAYERYAKVQEQKSKKLIASYVAEVNSLIKNVLKRQGKPDIQMLKKEIIATAKMQCSLQRRGIQAAKKGSGDDFAKPSIIVFVSFSMPKESIKGWIRQAKVANASIYIRGLVNNSFKDTAMAVSELVRGQSNGGLLIDPNLFKKYSIAQVPAVVVVRESEEAKGLKKSKETKEAKKTKETKKTKKDSFDVIYGDVTLDYALEKIRDSIQGKERCGLLKVIRRLRGKNG